jgi:hypothetical protein
MRRGLVAPLVALLALVLSASGVLASGGRILVYAGNAAIDEGYTKFGAAAGKPVDTLFVLPSDLSPYDCIVLPINNVAFDEGQKAQLSSYVNSGGTVLALAEHIGFLPGSIATMNDLATYLGAGLQVVGAADDPGFTTTTNIDPSTFTVGVNSIRYALTSEVEVLISGDAESLVRTQNASGAKTFIGADRIGSGVFLLSGDSNVFSDNSDTGYTVQDNGVLVANLCGEKGPGEPATLTLSPKTATNPVDTEHCVTATVKDAAGQPVPGVLVRFTVAGSSNTSGSATTNSDGEATFCYDGPALPGADAIHAFADTDENGAQGAPPPAGNEPFDDATKTWVLPVTTPGCEINITNGGWIVARNGDRASFGGNAKADEDGNVTGEEEYQDRGPADPFNLHGDVMVIVCGRDGKSGTIFGQNATIDGTGSHVYRLDVVDNGEPGNKPTDTYEIRIDNGYDSGSQPLQGGNIQVQKS